MSNDNLRKAINASPFAARLAKSTATLGDASDRFNRQLKANKNARLDAFRGGRDRVVHIPKDTHRRTQRSTAVDRSDFLK